MLNKITATTALLMLSASVLAHDLDIFPSAHHVGKTPKAVPVDITATHGVYRFDFPVSADGITVFGVDGEPVRAIGTVVQSARRTSFDLQLNEEGTYKIIYDQGRPFYMTYYTVGDRDTQKRLRGANKSAAAEQAPANAKNLETVKYIRSAVTFINAKKPTKAVLEPTGKGFELVPVTHPADYVNGEPITLRILLDGKPLAGADVHIYAEHGQYNGKSEPITLQTNEAGEVTTTFEEGGRFAARILYTRASQDKEADKDALALFYTFEVVYE